MIKMSFCDGRRYCICLIVARMYHTQVSPRQVNHDKKIERHIARGFTFIKKKMFYTGKKKFKNSTKIDANVELLN